MKMKFLAMCLLSGILALAGCTEKKEEGISTDMVNNPLSGSDAEVSPEDIPALEFDDVLFDFGTVSEGEKVKHSYVFTNSGKSDLIITSAKGSCGCTVPTWPKEPIAPGGKSKIDVVFDSDGRVGDIHKKISIVANTQPATTILALKGKVVGPDQN